MKIFFWPICLGQLPDQFSLKMREGNRSARGWNSIKISPEMERGWGSFLEHVGHALTNPSEPYRTQRLKTLENPTISYRTLHSKTEWHTMTKSALN